MVAVSKYVITEDINGLFFSTDCEPCYKNLVSPTKAYARITYSSLSLARWLKIHEVDPHAEPGE